MWRNELKIFVGKTTVSEVFISIIMPTYNRSYCIKNAIDSLLRQKISGCELIVVDDGSTDDTEKLIKESYLKEIEKGMIVYKKLRHKGAAKARNEGLILAKGTWIGYLDSDNEMTSDYILTYLDAIKKYPDSKFFYAKMHCLNSGEVVGRAFNRELLLHQNYIDMGTMLHHRECVEKCGNFDENLKRFIDYDLILRYIKFYEPIFIDKVVLEYNDFNDKKRITNTEKLVKARKYIAKKYGIEDWNFRSYITFYGKIKLFLLKIEKLIKSLPKDKYREKRNILLILHSTLFDEKWYLQHYSDVANMNICAVEHYYKYGWKEGYNPSELFDGNDYLRRYPDVADRKINPLLHYLQIGAREGRRSVSCLETSQN